MRYKLLNRLRLLVQDTDKCRRLNFLPYFEDKATEEKYRCEFCDICNSSLDFRDKNGKYRLQSERRLEVDDLSELEKEFVTWLLSSKLFDIKKGDYYILAFKDYPINTYAKATRILDTSNPYNIKALYIARHFAGQDEKLSYSRGLLEIANIRQRLDLDTVWTLYETTEESLKPQVFPALCDLLGMLLKSTEGEQWLFGESEALFKQRRGVDSETVDLLGLRVIANELPKFNLSSHKNRITELMEDF